MSKLNELFEAISKHSKDHGIRVDSIRLRKDLCKELEKAIPPTDHSGGNLSLISGIRVESMNVDNIPFGNNVELIAVINDQYAYSRITKDQTVKWSVVDLGPSLWNDKFPEYGSPITDKILDSKFWNKS